MCIIKAEISYDNDSIFYIFQDICFAHRAGKDIFQIVYFVGFFRQKKIIIAAMKIHNEGVENIIVAKLV